MNKKGKNFTKPVREYYAISQWVHYKKYDLDVCTIFDETLNFNLNLVVGNDEEMCRFFKDEYNEDLTVDNKLGAYMKAYDKEKVAWHWIQLKSYNNLFTDFGTIAHEVHHFIHGVAREDGVEYGEGGEEVFGSLQGYFTEMIIRALEARRKALRENKKKYRKQIKKRRK